MAAAPGFAIAGLEGKGVSTMKNLMLGMLLAALLMGPAAWAQAGQVVWGGLSAAAAEFGHSRQPVSVSTTVRSVLVRSR